MYAWQFAKLQYTAEMRGWTQFVAMQNQYNLLRRQDERELLPMCADLGVSAVPYSPQGKGRLVGLGRTVTPFQRGQGLLRAFDSPLDEPVVNAVQRVSEARGAQAWLRLRWRGC